MKLNEFIKDYLACGYEVPKMRSLVNKWKSTPGLYETVKANKESLWSIFHILVADRTLDPGFPTILLTIPVGKNGDHKTWMHIRSDNAMSCGEGFEF